jgi:HupE / UreJ protein
MSACRLMALVKRLCVVWALLLQLLPMTASAHLMMPQQGTLKFINGGGYLVLSLPVSAFPYAVSAANGLLSLEDFAKHQDRMTRDVETGVQLLDRQGALKLEGIFLNFTPPDNDPKGAVSQIVVLGRFGLRHGDDVHLGALTWRIALFGTAKSEQTFTATVTRADFQTGEKIRQAMVFSPEVPERKVFPPVGAVFADYLWLGMEHILTGLDHLLFLLVVLSSAVGWRQVLLLLTCFTVGHAVTLSLSLVAGLQVPSNVVEPIIALTIVGMAFFDLWARRRKFVMPHTVRLGLVFGCALIHGLALASSLEALGLDPAHLLASLLGFNSGIELGQIVVSLAVGMLAMVFARMRRRHGLVGGRLLASWAAIGIGGFWFVQRIV